MRNCRKCGNCLNAHDCLKYPKSKEEPIKKSKVSMIKPPNPSDRCCSACREIKNLSEFTHRSGNYYASVCKPCHRIMQKEYRDNNPLREVHRGMKQRCYNPKRKDYHIYGGKGITVCDEWHDYKNFEAWALSNGYKQGLTIDRKKSELGYSPDNCEWVTMSENSRRMWASRNRQLTLF